MWVRKRINKTIYKTSQNSNSGSLLDRVIRLLDRVTRLLDRVWSYSIEWQLFKSSWSQSLGYSIEWYVTRSSDPFIRSSEYYSIERYTFKSSWTHLRVYSIEWWVTRSSDLFTRSSGVILDRVIFLRKSLDSNYKAARSSDSSLDRVTSLAAFSQHHNNITMTTTNNTNHKSLGMISTTNKG